MLSAFIGRFRYLVSLARCLLHSDSLNSLKACDILLFCHDVDRPIDLCEKAYSPILDSIKEDFETRGLSCVSIAHFGSVLTGREAYGKPISFNNAYLRYLLKKKLLRLFGLSVSARINPFVDILEKTSAKLVLTIGSPIELSSAAKIKGVFHVEVLHGLGYTMLPWGWDKRPKVCLPHGILSLDEVSTKTFRQLEYEKDNIRTIPHPFLKRFRPDKYSGLPAEWRLRATKSPKYFKRILVSLNWGYAGDHGPHAQFANILSNGLFYSELSELVREEFNIFWHFRFHPVQLRKSSCRHLLEYMDNFVSIHSNSEWREASRVPLPEIAMNCDGNIGMSSMSCYDAAAMGLPSLMLCPTIQQGSVQQDRFADLENEGYVTKASINKEMLRRWIYEVRKTTPRLSNIEDADSWESAFKWMLQKSGLEYRIYCQTLK